jgi:cell fate (sporulation/competence/biofilm development) regulator YlbF (YheA/YmcA/DUF963 family)
MQAIDFDHAPIGLKTRELCQTILDHAGVKAMRGQIDAFMADEQARAQYEAVVARGQALQDKHDRSLPLDPAEVDAFDREREALSRNPVARGFMEAQEGLHQVRQSVQRYVTKTLELGRLPTEEDFQNSCGHGCECGH